MKIKKKKLLDIKNGIILCSVFMALSLTACGTKAPDVNNEVAENDRLSIEENDKEVSSEKDKNQNKNKPTENTAGDSNNNTANNKTQNKQESSTEKVTDTNTGNSSNTDTPVQNMNGLTALTYTSDTLGITFNVPESWKGKYDVLEEEGKVSVYMKHIDNITGTGLLFVIKKQNVEKDEVLNSIDGVESVDINGETFVVGGPSGYCMDDGDRLIPTYNQMIGECVYPVNSIKSK